MSVKYKILDHHGLNFRACTICGWVGLFSRAEFRDIVLDSWVLLRTQRPSGLGIGYIAVPVTTPKERAYSMSNCSGRVLAKMAADFLAM